MDTYSIQAMIMARQDLTAPEKCLALCLAHARDRRTGRVIRSREWMSTATSLKGGSLRRAIAGLVQKGVVTATRTVRATIYKFAPALEEICGDNKDGPDEDHQTVPMRTIGKPRKKPRYPKIRRELTSRADDGCATMEYAVTNDLEFMEAVRRDSREKREKDGGWGSGQV